MRWLLALLAMLVSLPAQADELRPGYLEFTERAPGQWRLVWKAPVRGGVTPATQAVLPDLCRTEGPAQRELAGQAVVTRVAVVCSGPVAGQRIGLSNFNAAQTDALVRVQPRGAPMQLLRLTATAPLAEIAAQPSRWEVARTYFRIGVEHILFGYDHLLFVVAMVLLLGGFWQIAKAVTAFTVAHSLTLIGTTLGLLGLPQAPVEAVIALSILFLAVEVVKSVPGAPRLSERVPWVVAFGFGLLHGFGFAGALAEIGLPENDVPTALLTFNLGVEAGQLMIVAATAASLAALRHWRPAVAPAVVRFSAYAIGTIAAYWTIARLAG